ncbi:unnamed protein product [Parascedosporium putredinis]|uniref:Aminoglycoside phosphotransferase domain-containing protein n=1 Tax=Parascedosporium putredinis TaxID=1442378 RepID=A0A9P1H6A5_9PEZI|nr:unnamed protein product [Parascedosporium putredinis]CAI8000048.1 unnamed protein product [Parascedosporium putredinis]
MSQTPVHVVKEYHGLPPPNGYRTPTPAELVGLCTKKHPRGFSIGLAHPPEAPVFWIKYGFSVLWNEVPAQVMAYEELRSLQSPIRAPGIFYACAIKETPGSELCTLFIVMEFIPGRTAEEWLKSIQDPVGQNRIYSFIALALSELHRIPVPPDSRPASIDKGRIRHALFDMYQAPRHYENVGQLEDHLNCPMVFCYSDLWLQNFMIDDDDNVAVVDFAVVSILPSSFSKLVLFGEDSKIGRDISNLVQIPTTKGVDNTAALYDVCAPMVFSPHVFASIGCKLPGDIEVKELG